MIEKMKTSESVLVLIIIGYVLAVFSAVVIEYKIKNQNYESQPMQMVELFDNGSARSFEIENPSPDPDLFSSILLSLNRFVFAFPFVVIGIGIIGDPMYFLSSSQTMPPEGYRVLAFWMIGIGATVLTAMYTRDISLWRRLPYIYLIMAIISGTPILLSSNFGQ